MSASPEDALLRRARALAEDLNFSTMGRSIPSDRIIEDFAVGQHGLRAEEHELTDVPPDRRQEPGRRAFSIYGPDDSRGDELVGLLLERPEAGWTLLVPDR